MRPRDLERERSPSRRLRDQLPFVYEALAWVTPLVILVALGALGYLMYGLLSDTARRFAEVTPEEQARLLHIAGNASDTFIVAAWIGCLLLLVRFFHEFGVTLLLAAIGAGFYFGMPFLVPATTGGITNPLTDAMTATFIGAGKGLMIIAASQWALKLFVDVVWGAKERITQPKMGVQSDGRERRKFSGVKFPWTRVYSCTCDEVTPEMLAGGLDPASFRDQAGFDAARARVQRTMATLKARRFRYSKKARKELCRECPMFLQYQMIKYNYLRWVPYPLTVGLLWAFYPRLLDGYMWLIRQMESRAGQLAFAPAGGSSQTTGMMQDFANTSVFPLVVVLTGIFMVTYLVRIVEWYCLEAKL